MKKILLLISALLLIGVLFASCGGETPEGPGGDTPGDNPGETPIDPTIKGDSAVIFAKDSAFTLVYPSADLAVSANTASSIMSKVAALGLKKPAFSADDAKTASKCELLIGDTKRAISATAKSIVTKNAKEDPEGEHWIWLYSNGQLALYANCKEAYDLAVEELVTKYLVDGEILFKTNAKDVGYVPGPHEAYMEYEIYKNYYDGYTDPFGVQESDYKEMTITRLSDDLITIEYKVTNDTGYCVNFVKKSWGMWMLGSMTYVDEGRSHTLTPNGTDYEFVFTCNNEGDLTFRSGNHGNYPGDPQEYVVDDTSKSNDYLVDMTFYDAKTGNKINLDKVGNKAKVNGLRVVMHHNVYEKNYVQENVLMNVEKNYLFNGFDVLLDSSIYMTKDVYFSSSYSCMLPILKAYGNCMLLYNEDKGTTIYAKSATTGDGSGKSYTVWNNVATKVELWGEQYPEYHLTVAIHNPEDQFVGCSSTKGFVGLCDMLGGNQNKIYFAFGSAGMTLKHGEELHFVNSWTFEKVEGFENLDRTPDVSVIKPN